MSKKLTTIEITQMSLFDLNNDVMGMVLEYMQPLQHLRKAVYPRMFNPDIRRIVDAQIAKEDNHVLCYARMLLRLWNGARDNWNNRIDRRFYDNTRVNGRMNIHGLPIITRGGHENTCEVSHLFSQNVYCETSDATHEVLNECLERLGIRGVKSKTKNVKMRAIINYK